MTRIVHTLGWNGGLRCIIAPSFPVCGNSDTHCAMKTAYTQYSILMITRWPEHPSVRDLLST